MERKLNRINNMSARATYDLIYHQRRMLGKAVREGDRKLTTTMFRLLSSWIQDEPTIACNALKSHTDKGVKRG